MKKAEQKLEDLREFTNQLTKRKMSFSDKNRHIVEDPIIQFKELPKPGSMSSDTFYMNYTMTVAINQYVGKGTQLKQYSIKMIEDGAEFVDSDTDNAIYRMMRYMIDNGKGTLSYYMEKSFFNYLSDFEDEFKTKVSVLKIILITDPIVAIILLFMFIPFILKVQSSLQRIYLHLCQFHVADIKKWLDACNNSASDIKASITRMQRIYNEEVFEINPADYDKRTRMENEAAKMSANNDMKKSLETPTNATQKTSPDVIPTPNKGAGDEEEEGMVVQSQEAAISERKQRAFSEMSREKTKIYLGYLTFFILYIAAFKIADAVLLSYFYDDTYVKLSSIKLFNLRGWDQDNAVFFFRENLAENKIMSYFECIFSNMRFCLVPDATDHYVNEGFEREFDVSRKRSNLNGDLQPLKDLLNRLDSTEYCAVILHDPELLNRILVIVLI